MNVEIIEFNFNVWFITKCQTNFLIDNPHNFIYDDKRDYPGSFIILSRIDISSLFVALFIKFPIIKVDKNYASPFRSGVGFGLLI